MSISLKNKATGTNGRPTWSRPRTTYIVRTGFFLVALMHVSKIWGDAKYFQRYQGYLSTSDVMVLTNDKDDGPNKNTTATDFSTVKEVEHYSYKPSFVEQYLLDNSRRWGWDRAEKGIPGCSVWKDPNQTTTDIHAAMHRFKQDLEQVYYPAINAMEPIPDLMSSLRKLKGDDHSMKEELCKQAKPHPDGIQALFPNSVDVLSFTSSLGYAEPLMTPMRHPKYCYQGRALLNLDYFVHDFEAMCRHSLKPTSRRILFDFGASLTREKNPMSRLLEVYKKFGFTFDHIYAFEVKHEDPTKVYQELLSTDDLSSYHWINTAVDPTKHAKLNPLYSILQKFDEDDFIVIKLDVDSAEVELPLVDQILEEEEISSKVDHLYFEHHVFLGEMAGWWTRSMRGSIQDSLELFHKLRQRGVVSHFWV